jgi:hypothetical protein
MISSSTGVLDYSIKESLIPSMFYGWTDKEGSSSMVSKPRSWVQFLPATQFSAARIPPSLTAAGSVGTATPEREQAAPTAATRTQEGDVGL